MTMGRQDPGGLNAATSTGMVAHGASNYNLNYYGVTADTPQNYGSMYYMDFGSAEEDFGRHRGDGRGSRRRRRREHQRRSRRPAAIRCSGSVQWSVTGKGYWDKFTSSNITDELRAQGVTDPTLRNLQRLQRRRRRAVPQGSSVVVRVVPQLLDRRGDAVLHHRQPGRQPDEPVRLQPAQLHGEQQVSGQQEQRAVGVLDLQPEVPAAPRRRRDAAEPDQHAAPGIAEEPVQRQLDVGVGPEHVPGGVVDLLPHALAEHVDGRIQRPAGRPAAAVDVQRHHRHLHRRSRADRAAAARRLPAPDQHRRHALHRRLPRRQPSAEDRLRELVDADRHRRLRDLRRLAPALHRRGRCRATRP